MRGYICAAALVATLTLLSACPPPDRTVHVAWGPSSAQDVSCGAIFELFIFDETLSASGFGATKEFRVRPGWVYDLTITLENDISESCDSVGYTISFEEGDIYFLTEERVADLATYVKQGELRDAGEYHTYKIQVQYGS